MLKFKFLHLGQVLRQVLTTFVCTYILSDSMSNSKPRVIFISLCLFLFNIFVLLFVRSNIKLKTKNARLQIHQVISFVRALEKLWNFKCFFQNLQNYKRASPLVGYQLIISPLGAHFNYDEIHKTTFVIHNYSNFQLSNDFPNSVFILKILKLFSFPSCSTSGVDHFFISSFKI